VGKSEKQSIYALRLISLHQIASFQLTAISEAKAASLKRPFLNVTQNRFLKRG
jgi:hypothetical protein